MSSDSPPDKRLTSFRLRFRLCDLMVLCVAAGCEFACYRYIKPGYNGSYNVVPFTGILLCRGCLGLYVSVRKLRRLWEGFLLGFLLNPCGIPAGIILEAVLPRGNRKA